MNNKILAIAGFALLAVASPPLATSADAGYRSYRGYYGGTYRSYNRWAYAPRAYRSYNSWGYAPRAYKYSYANVGMPSWYKHRFYGWRVGANTN